MKSRLLTILSFMVMTFITNAQISSVAIIGSGTPGGWGTETPMTLLDETLQLYGITINLTKDEVKFRANNAWDINWGARDFPIGEGVQGGPNIPIAVAGEYDVLFSALTGEYFFYYESPIGIIGDATPTGWDEDINLFPSATDTNAYFITLPLVQGKAKFRQNDAWAINWGAADFPAGVGVQNGADIPIPSAGKYEITFNKSTGAYKFTELVDFKSIGIIGSATPLGWDQETALTKDGGNADIWRGTITLKEGEFKFRADSSWALNWGGGSFPSDTASVNGDNIKVSADQAGDYLYSFNTKTLVYNFLKIGNYKVVSIIGNATPGGWDKDSDMTQDPSDKSVWRGRLDLVQGECKFRADNDWIINWGGDGFPSGVATQDGPNIQIPADGDYKITFNSTTGAYNFESVVEYDKISLVGKSGPFGEWPGSDDSRDTYLTKDPADANHWTHAGVTLTDFAATTDGGVKFRAEAAWAINWGAKDFPSGVGVQNGPNIEPKAGTYKIDFRSDTGEYAFGDPTSTYNLLSNDVIKVFPNPAKDIINIEINTEAISGQLDITLFNAQGQIVRQQSSNINGIARINVSDLISGNYTMRLTNAKNIISKNMVIIK